MPYVIHEFAEHRGYAELLKCPESNDLLQRNKDQTKTNLTGNSGSQKEMSSVMFSLVLEKRKYI